MSTTSTRSSRGFVYQSPGTRSNMEDAAWSDYQSKLVMCDGMGEHDDGELAATALVELVKVSDAETIKARAVEVVTEAASNNGGTTCSVAYLDGSELRWLHCGDSALWLVARHKGKTTIRRLTSDQSLWGTLYAKGTRGHKHGKSILMSAVQAPHWSGRPNPDPVWDEGCVDIPPGKVWVFGTSDGFHEAFEDDDRVVNQDRLVEGLRLLAMASTTEIEVSAYMDGCGNQTHDNATVVGWRVR